MRFFGSLFCSKLLNKTNDSKFQSTLFLAVGFCPPLKRRVNFQFLRGPKALLQLFFFFICQVFCFGDKIFAVDYAIIKSLPEFLLIAPWLALI